MKTYVWNGLVQPVIDLFQTMSKARPHGMRLILCVMLLNMVFYYSTIQEIYILYQFCKLKYDVTYTEVGAFYLQCCPLWPFTPFPY